MLRVSIIHFSLRPSTVLQNHIALSNPSYITKVNIIRSTNLRCTKLYQWMIRRTIWIIIRPTVTLPNRTNRTLSCKTLDSNRQAFKKTLTASAWPQPIPFRREAAARVAVGANIAVGRNRGKRIRSYVTKLRPCTRHSPIWPALAAYPRIYLT